MKKDETPEVQPEGTKEPDFLKQYRECYPNCKKFHVTSDNLVFLDKQLDAAKAHQSKIQGELKTY